MYSCILELFTKPREYSIIKDFDLVKLSKLAEIVLQYPVFALTVMTTAPGGFTLLMREITRKRRKLVALILV